VTRDLTFPATDVEDAPRSTEVMTDQRNDLLGVFGVGAFGEVPLPPRGVPFPEHLVVVHGAPCTQRPSSQDDEPFVAPSWVR
jgi:hypothetical protein